MRAVGAVIALLFVLVVSAAWAGNTVGKIQSINPGDRVVVLEDGTKLWIAEGLSIDGLKQGATIKASYEERDGKNVVTGFEVSE